MILCRRSFFSRTFGLTHSLHTWQSISVKLRPDLFEDLEARGFIQDSTRPPSQLQESFTGGRRVVYAGIDPTANALHVGHLIPLMCLLHFQLRGHQIIPLIGGATGLIGDPSGRSTERNRAEPAEVESNVKVLTQAVEKFFKNAASYAEQCLGGPTTRTYYPANVTTNLLWHKDLTLLQFLQEVGFHSRVSTMLNRESVRARMDSQQGISFTEFTYQLLQAYDFYFLHKNHQCILQIGGSDQWGNILAGVDLIQGMQGSGPEDSKERKAMGLTTPLLTTPSGDKFGKSSGNAIWLDPQKTRPVDFYQFWLKTFDTDVESYLKMFTILPLEKIKRAIESHKEAPERRVAQKLLASEVTTLVHGEAGLAKARALTGLLYDTKLRKLSTQDILEAMRGDSRLIMIDRTELLNTTVPKLAAVYGLVASASQARDLCKNKGLYVNDMPFTDPRNKISAYQLVDHRVAVIRAGRTKFLALVASD